MSRLRTLLARLAGSLRRARGEQELNDEIESHLQLHTDDNLRAGMSPEEARRSAVLKFGGIEATKEAMRDRQRLPWLELVAQDVRFAVRSLKKAPGFTAIAVLTLALCIGANTAIFSLVHVLMLRPLPFPHPEQLALVWRNSARETISDEFTSWPAFSEWRAQNKTFAALTGYSISNVSLTGSGEPEQLPAVYAGDHYLDVLGVQPIQGRWISEEEQIRGKEGVVVLSHGLWLRWFGADPAILGKGLQINGRLRTVIGVMPPGFAYPARTDFYLPLAPDDRIRAGWNIAFLNVAGRLKPGVAVEQAQADLDAITANIARQHPTQKGHLAKVVGLHAWTVRNVSTALWVLLGAVGCVLLIACANLAGLLLARGLARRREMAVRVALGASRARIVGELLTESLVLAVTGGGLGLLLGKWTLDVIKAFAASALPTHTVIGVDPGVLAVTAGVSLCCGIGFGLLPAWLASRTTPLDALKEGARNHSAGRSAQVTRASLVVAQTALAVVLLIGAGLLIRSFWKLSQVETGLRGDRLVTMPLVLGNNYDRARVGAFRQTITERLAALPGVEAAGLTTNILLLGIKNAFNFTLEGQPNPPGENRLQLTTDAISPEYFATIGLPIVEGRGFNAGDAQDAPRVAIINETTARKFWPGQSAIGRRFILGDLPGGPDAKGQPRAPNWITIVGVVKDSRRDGPDRPIRIESWYPLAQRPENRFRAVVRTSLPAAAIARSLREAVWSIDKDLPVPSIEPVSELLDASTTQRRLNLGLLASFAALALVLATLGLYGVMAYSVNQRTGEFGIRFALGAQPGDVQRLVVSQASRLVALGLVIGLLAALALGRVIEALLFDTPPHDALTYTGVTVLLALVALVAAWLPARRASRVNPITALRCD